MVFPVDMSLHLHVAQPHCLPVYVNKSEWKLNVESQGKQ